MAERSGFFPYAPGDTNSEYDHVFLARFVASFISNGIYNGTLVVTFGDHMQIVLPEGQAWINGYYYRNDGNLVLPITNADGVLHRKDTVVLRWDINTRSITAKVLQGIPASSPTAPSIVRTAEQYDLKLAEISIPAGTTAITQALITDTRFDNNVCGIVHAIIDHLDTTTFYNQIQADLANFKNTNEAEFTAWFNEIKNVLDSSTAGHLQSEIDAITNAKGQPNGYAELDANGNLKQMPTAAQTGALPIARTRLNSMSELTNLGEGHYLMIGTDTAGTPTNTNIWLINVNQEGWGEVAVAYGDWDASIYICLRSTSDNGVTFNWSPWKCVFDGSKAPYARKADFAGGSTTQDSNPVKIQSSVPTDTTALWAW